MLRCQYLAIIWKLAFVLSWSHLSATSFVSFLIRTYILIYNPRSNWINNLINNLDSVMNNWNKVYLLQLIHNNLLLQWHHNLLSLIISSITLNWNNIYLRKTLMRTIWKRYSFFMNGLIEIFMFYGTIIIIYITLPFTMSWLYWLRILFSELNWRFNDVWWFNCMIWG